MKKRTTEAAQISTEDISTKPRTPFSIDELKMAWRAFAFQIKNSDRQASESAFSIMTKKDPKVDDFHVTYEVDNSVMHEILVNSFGEELQSFLREKLKNWGITLEVKIVDNSDNLPQFLTSKQRFEMMANKNRNLITLLKTFNLDIDL